MLPPATADVQSRTHTKPWQQAPQRTCVRRLLVSDATASRIEAEKELADMTAESMMLGPIPILWKFGKEVGRCVR